MMALSLLRIRGYHICGMCLAMPSRASDLGYALKKLSQNAELAIPRWMTRWGGVWPSGPMTSKLAAETDPLTAASDCAAWSTRPCAQPAVIAYSATAIDGRVPTRSLLIAPASSASSGQPKAELSI
jgi:hypothetical protein